MLNRFILIICSIISKSPLFHFFYHINIPAAGGSANLQTFCNFLNWLLPAVIKYFGIFGRIQGILT